MNQKEQKESLEHRNQVYMVDKDIVKMGEFKGFGLVYGKTT